MTLINRNLLCQYKHIKHDITLNHWTGVDALGILVDELQFSVVSERNITYVFHVEMPLKFIRDQLHIVTEQYTDMNRTTHYIDDDYIQALEKFVASNPQMFRPK